MINKCLLYVMETLTLSCPSLWFFFVFFNLNVFALWELTGVAIADTLGSESSVPNVLKSTSGLSICLKRKKLCLVHQLRTTQLMSTPRTICGLE